MDKLWNNFLINCKYSSKHQDCSFNKDRKNYLEDQANDNEIKNIKKHISKNRKHSANKKFILVKEEGLFFLIISSSILFQQK